jgi:outer membrane protein assembly factor BamA
VRSLFFTLIFITFPSFLFADPQVRIRHVYINNLDVFDSQHQDFRWWGFRFMNRLHVKTQKSFIRNELLLKEGDLLEPDLMHESERNLRRYTFLTDVSVRSRVINDQEADLFVNTEDQWTMKPSLSWGTVRGARTLDVGVEEENFLGLGRRVGLKYEKAPERDGFEGLYGDPRFLNTRLRLNLRYARFSDGNRFNYGLTQPFYSQEARWSYGVDGFDLKRLQHFYFQGIDAAALEHVQNNVNFDLLRAWGPRYQRNRAGLILGYSQNLYPSVLIFDEEAAQEEAIQQNLDPVENELFNVGMSLIRDRQRFVKFYYVDNFGRTEDLPYGTLAGMSIIHSNDDKGEDFFTGNFSGTYTFHRNAKQYFVSHAGLSLRREGGEWNNWIAELLVRYYIQKNSTKFGFFKSPKQTLAANLAATITADMDSPFQLSLGEDEGLRGYPFRGFTGLNRALLNLEYRVLLPWEHRLMGIGVVPFVDAGYVWNPDHLFGCSAGIGLRIGLKKYGRTRVLRIDYAFPFVNTKGKGGSLSVSTGQVFDIL